jgi:bacteriocin-like protein
MANITISDLSPTGAELLSDEELTDEELSNITGGVLGPLTLSNKMFEVVYMKRFHGLDYDWRSNTYYYDSRYIA